MTIRAVRLTLAVLVLCAAACATDSSVPPAGDAGGQTDQALATDDDKAFYALGLGLARQLTNFDLTEAELQLVKQGLTDGALNRKPKVTLEEMRTKVQQIAQERSQKAASAEKAKGTAFAEKAAAEPGATKLDDGVVIEEITAGTGDTPAATDKVKVHYRGTLIDGTVFDSSIDRGQPATFPLNGVIKCWTEGLQHLKVGGKSKLVCPSDTAYGDRGRPPTIPPGATLVFEVDLLEIVKN
jgi:FKBP-type peptidyl-prolyl cis-trans isomerase FkpA